MPIGKTAALPKSTDALRDQQFAVARAMDQSPDDVATLQKHVFEELEALGDKAKSMQAHQLFQQVYGPAMDRFNSHPKAKKALAAVSDRYAALAGPQRTSNTKPTSPGTPKPEIAWIPVLALGLVGGAVIVGAICIYIAVKGY